MQNPVSAYARGLESPQYFATMMKMTAVMMMCQTMFFFAMETVLAESG